jgi:organic radical activating enzyme
MKFLIKHLLNKYGVELDEKASMDDFVQAYIKAKNAQVAIVYPQQLHFINLDLTSYCNLNCYSCNHFIDSAPTPTREILTLEQVKDFVKESQKLQWRWDELRLTGGEPSIHPDFKEILEVLTEGLKKDYLPNITLKIISNGTGKKVRRTLDFDNAKIFSFNEVTDGFSLEHIGHPDWTVVCSKPLKDTAKKLMIKNHEGIEELSELIPDFGNVWQAPVDRLDEIANLYKGDKGAINPSDGYTPPRINQKVTDLITKKNLIMDCQVHATCGFELTRYGYTPCPCGGGRVVGDESIFFKSLSDITLDECYKKLAKMCVTCGRNLNYNIDCSTRTEKTEFWKLILSKYRRDPPKMSLYDPFNKREACND